MKKKVIFAIATSLFALAMVFNMNLLQANSAGDVSLDGIAVMAQAQGESSWSRNCYPCGWVCKIDQGSYLLAIQGWSNY